MDSKKTKLPGKILVLVMAIVLMAGSFAFFNNKKFIVLADSVVPENGVYYKSGENLDKLTESFGVSPIADKGTFTMNFRGSFTPVVYRAGEAAPCNVYYTLELTGESLQSDGEALNFLQNTYIRLIDFSNVGGARDASDKIYSITVDNTQTSSLNLAYFSYGIECFRDNYALTVGSLETENFQIIVDLSRTDGTMPDSTITLRRHIVTATSTTHLTIGEIDLSFFENTTTFALSSTVDSIDYFYSGTPNPITLTITPTTSGDVKEIYSQYGRGIRVKLNGQILPALSKFVVIYNNRQYGNDWSSEKSVDFSVVNASALECLISIPKDAISDGTKTLTFEIFDEFGTVFATKNISINVVNTDFIVTTRSYTKTSSTDYQSSFVYYVSDDADISSVKIAVEILEELPDDASIGYILEKRNLAYNYLQLDENASETVLAKTNFSSLYSISVLTKAIQLNNTFTSDDEGVYRLKINVYDGSNNLASTAYAYFVVVEKNHDDCKIIFD